MYKGDPEDEPEDNNNNNNVVGMEEEASGPIEVSMELYNDSLFLL